MHIIWWLGLETSQVEMLKAQETIGQWKEVSDRTTIGNVSFVSFRLPQNYSLNPDQFIVTISMITWNTFSRFNSLLQVREEDRLWALFCFWFITLALVDIMLTFVYQWKA